MSTSIVVVVVVIDERGRKYKANALPPDHVSCSDVSVAEMLTQASLLRFSISFSAACAHRWVHISTLSPTAAIRLNKPPLCSFFGPVLSLSLPCPAEAEIRKFKDALLYAVRVYTSIASCNSCMHRETSEGGRIRIYNSRDSNSC